MKTKEINVKIEKVVKLRENIYRLIFYSPYLSKNSLPGQFLHIKIEGTILRRPFSINRIEDKYVHILFKVRGKGTKLLSLTSQGDTLNILGPLGKGFMVNSSYKRYIILGPGIGVAPLVYLVQKMNPCLKDKEKIVILGAKNKREILEEEEFKKYSWNTFFCTEDGSRGFKGTIVDFLHKILLSYDNFSTLILGCGSYKMAEKVYSLIKDKESCDCQFALEQFMGCGLGVCCACVIKTKNGYKKICKDGPVFNLKDIF